MGFLAKDEDSRTGRIDDRISKIMEITETENRSSGRESVRIAGLTSIHISANIET